MVLLLQKNIRLFLAAIVVAAFMAQSLIPAGFMPASAAGAAKFPLVICTMQGPKTVFVDAAQLPKAPAAPVSSNDHPSKLCAFACAALKTALLAVYAVVAVFISLIQSLLVSNGSFLDETFFNAYFAQGPPSFLC